MAAVLPDPLYYLHNFRHVLAWVEARHADLLDAEERGRIARIGALPQAAQALLVRLVMRKGELFRHSKLAYAEIGAIAPAAAALAAQGLVERDPSLALDEVFALLRKDELHGMRAALPGERLSPKEQRALQALRKDELLECLRTHFSPPAAAGTASRPSPEPRPLAGWHATLADTVYRLRDAGFYDLLRLLFFGNLHQDWSEFVLTDLGLLRYETVEVPADARVFGCRADVEAYRTLHALRTRLEDGEAPADLLAEVPGLPAPAGTPSARRSGLVPTRTDTEPGVRLKPDLASAPAYFANAWLEERRGKLLFHIGQQLEREKDWPAALVAYQASKWPEARRRTIRVLEQDDQPQAAFELARAVLAAAPREEERQQLARTLPRLRRKLGLAKETPEALLAPAQEDLRLPVDATLSVEWTVQAHLHRDDAPVFYVENALVNSLFGLLCWPAIFAPVPGAFFHAFQYGPADLHHPDFATRRADHFAHCFAQLESGAYRDSILSTWREKQGMQSPFVFWETLDEALLTLALDCMSPAHLRALFTRLLGDIQNNCSGFPDLIRFWPAERRYLMLEVKGPGDRLQDNQRRWMDYCLRQGIPVAVAHVGWTE